VVLVEGITFDTGGISIKPSADMDHHEVRHARRRQRSGAFRAVAELKAKINLIGLIPPANMPSGRATKPGDIVTSMSGKPSGPEYRRRGQADSCDAHLRRALRALGGRRHATLTGAIVVALKTSHAACPATATPWRERCSMQAKNRSIAAGDALVGRLPDGQQFRRLRQYRYASRRQRDRGLLPFAFRKKFDWAHLESPAWRGRKARKRATGRPVALLTTWLLRRKARPLAHRAPP
jgi:leucyl aminopeptidase